MIFFLAYGEFAFKIADASLDFSSYCIECLPWSPPPRGYVKINVDGAVSKNDNRGAVASVCRDADGNYLGSSITLNGVTDVPTLETLACREAQALALDLLQNRIVIASDSMIVIRDIEAKTGGVHAAVIKEIVDRKFLDCSFVYESRRRNFEAGSLAKFSLSLQFGRHLWLDLPHDDVAIPPNIVVE